MNISEELFDIVDELDRPLGLTKLRADVHRELQDWHRVTIIYIMNEQKELLCQKRSMQKDVDPGVWQCYFGGHVQAGQSYSDAAVSELHEEVGLTVRPDDLHYLGTYQNEQSKHHGAVFVYRWDGKLDALHFQDGEVEEVTWLLPDASIQMKREQGFPDFAFHPLFLTYLNETVRP